MTQTNEKFVTELVTDSAKGELSIKEYEAALGKAAKKAKAAQDAVKGVGDAAKKTTPAMRIKEKAIKDANQQLDRLVRVQNPAALSAKRLAAAEKLVSDARRRGISITKAHTQAIDNLRAKMERQTKAANDNRRAANDNIKSVNAMSGAYSRLKSIIATVATTLVLKASIGNYAAFEEKLSEVKAVANASIIDMERLETATRKLGATTKFSATQAAEGAAFLGRAGFETNEIISALPGTLSLAAAGALELGDAADIASNILSGFGYAAEEMGRVSDVLALTAANANTNIQQLGDAMSYAAPFASALDISIEETAAAIGKLSDAGLQGERAGTGLRTALTSLVDLTPKATAAIKGLGLTVEDVNPATNSLTDILLKLKDAGLGVSEAVAIAGKKGGAAFLTMARQAEGVGELTEKLEAAEGAARRMALTMSDHVKGAAKRLLSALSELSLQGVGDSGLGGAIKSLIDHTANLVLSWTQFGDTLGADLATYQEVGGAIEAMAVGLGTYLSVLTVVRTATAIWAAATTVATGGLNLIIPAVAAASGAIYYWWEDITQTFDDLTEKVQRLGREFLAIIDIWQAAWNALDIGLEWQKFEVAGREFELPVGIDISFNREQFEKDFAAIQSYVQGAAADSLAGSAFDDEQWNSVATAIGDVKKELKDVQNPLTTAKGLTDEQTKAINKSLDSYFKYEEQQDRLVRSHEKATTSIEKRTVALELENKIAALQIEGAKGSELAILDLREEYKLAAIDAEIWALEQKKLNDLIGGGAKDAIQQQIDALEDFRRTTEESFDVQRQKDFSAQAKQSATDFKNAWSNSVSAVESLFDRWFGKIFDKMGVFGDLTKSFAKDFLNQFLGNTKKGGSIFDTIVSKIGSLFGKSSSGASAGGGLSSIGSSIGNALSLPFKAIASSFTSLSSSVGSALSVAFPSIASANVSAAGLGMLTGGAADFGTAGIAAAAGAPVLTGATLAALPIGMWLMSRDNTNTTSTATFGVNDAGGLDLREIGTNDGGDPAIAQAMADTATAMVNAFLDKTGTILKAGAFRGEVGYNRSQYASAVSRWNTDPRNDPSGDITGIGGLVNDIRGTTNPYAAQMDFVARSLLVAIEEETIEGLSAGASNTMKIGLGNIVRGVMDDVTDEASFKEYARKFDILTNHDQLLQKYGDGTAVVEDAAAAAERYNRAMTKQRAELAASAAEWAGTDANPLKNIGTYLEDAKSLFDPLGPAKFQLRRNLNKDADSLFTQIIDSAIGDDLGRASMESGFATLGENAYQAMFDGFEGYGLTFKRNIENEMEQGGNRVFDIFKDGSKVNSVALDHDPTYSKDGEALQKNTTKLVDAMIEAGAEFETFVDDFFTPDERDRLSESFTIAKGMVKEALNTLALEPQDLEVLHSLSQSPPLTGLALLYEEQAAKIEALRPQLEELNEDLRAFGQTTIDVDADLANATGTLLNNVQDQFLGIVQDEAGTGSGVSGLIYDLKSQYDDKINQMNVLFGADDPRRGDAQDAIQTALQNDLTQILGQAVDRDQAIEEFLKLFENMDMTVVDDAVANISIAANDLTNSFNDMTANVQDQIRVNEGLIGTLEGAKARIASFRASLAFDSASSPLSPAAQLAAAEAAYENALRNTSSPDAIIAAQASSELVGLTNAYLKKAEDYYGATSDYYDIWQKVQDDLGGVEVGIDSQLSELRTQTSVLRDVLAELQSPSQELPDNFNWGANTSVNQSIYRALLAAGESLPTAFGNGELSALRAADSGVNSIVTALGFANGGVMTPFGPVNLYSRGGIANSPQLAMFGEGRMPEAFVPLPDGRTIPVTVRAGGAANDLGPLVSEVRALRAEVSAMRNERRTDHNEAQTTRNKTAKAITKPGSELGERAA